MLKPRLQAFLFMRQLLLALVLPLLFARHTSAQSCGTVSYNSDNGLAASNYLGVFQDSHGMLWVGSYGSGVSRFDGKHWEFWGTENGLLNNTTNNFFEDKEGGIWFDHNDHGASRWKDGKWQQFDYRRDTLAVGQLMYDRFYNKVFIVETGWYGKKSTRLFEYNYETRQFQATGKAVMPEKLLDNYTDFEVLQGSQESEWWVYAVNAAKRFGEYYHVRNGQAEKTLQFPDTYEEAARPVYTNAILSPEVGAAIVQNLKGIYILKKGRWEMMPAPTLPQYTPDARRLSLQFSGCSFDARYNSLFTVWYIRENAYVKRYVLAEYDATTLQLRQSLTFSNPFFGNVGYRQIRKDVAGTLWLATTGNVLRLFPDKLYLPINAAGMLPDAWGLAQAADGAIWFASNTEGLTGFDGLSFKPQPKGLQINKSYNDGSLTDPNGDMYFNSVNPPELGILKFDGKNRWELLKGTKTVIGFFLSRDKNGQILWGTSAHGLWILPKGKTGHNVADWQKIDQQKGLLLGNVLTSLQDKFGRYWMGRTSQGIAMYDPESEQVLNWLRNKNPKNYGLISMAEDPHGNLWMGTDRGLCFFENRRDIGPDFDLAGQLQRVGLDFTGESTVKSCLLYDAHTLVIGNARGLHLLDLDAFYGNPRRILIRSLNPKNGYQAGPVGQNALFVDRDSCIWLTASNGAFRYNPRLLPRDAATPEVFIDSIRIGNNMLRNISERVSFGHGQQMAQLYFHGSPNLMLYDNTSFEYRLSADSAWVKIPSGNAFVALQGLSPGTQRFEIRALKEGHYSKPVVTFLKVPYWWQNPMLWWGLLIAGVVLGLFLQRAKLQQTKKQLQIEISKNELNQLISNQELQISNQKLELEKSINEMARMSKEKDKLQVQAIVNQLNPHFINNALQWLQVRVDEDEEAVRVVGKLSENISTVFKNSRIKRAYHSLREELKLSENYLYIQKCRFGEKLSYEMPDEKTLSLFEHMNVPLMIVQIHAENAVEHGIRNKKTGIGKVLIRLEDTVDYAIITIEDDGVGREAAQKIGSKGTQNGTKMLQELELIYNKQNALPLEQRYEDGIFVDAAGERFGTRVVVRMPKQYNFEF